MLPRLFLSILLAMVSLCGIAAAAALPAVQETLHKRTSCAQYLPGALRLEPSAAPFRTCDAAPDVVSYFFQEDGNFVV
jgi:hypothetical protein